MLFALVIVMKFGVGATAVTVPNYTDGVMCERVSSEIKMRANVVDAFCVRVQ